MKFSTNYLTVFFLVFISFFSSYTFAHSVQVAYCTSCNGQLRLYIEHWHGAEDPNGTTMTIELTVGGVVSLQTGSPVANLQDIPFAQLPGCATPGLIFGSCSGQADTYNDWAVYDFPSVPCGVPVSIRIISGNTAFTQDGCGMYPASTGVFTIPCSIGSGTISNQTVCGGEDFTPINFTNPATASWTNSNTSIGLGASGTGNIPVFTAIGGLTTQTSVVNVSDGCQSNQFTLTVKPSPDPSFSFNSTNPTNNCRQSPVNFSITNPANITNPQWVFGDGGTSSINNPSHSYVANGKYNVSLIVTANSCTATSTQTVSVYTPTANFNLTNSCLNVLSTFTSTSTSPVSFASQVWNYGDGSSNGSGSISSHIYTSSNTYSVNLIVTDVNLCKDSIAKPITLYPNPVITFSASPVCLNVASSFTNNTTVAIPDNISSWAWDFDNDGAVDNNTQNPFHIYATSGLHVVELKATTNNNCRDSALVNIKVNESPIASFNPVSGCLNTNISLNNTSNILAPYNIVSYNWFFDVGSIPNLSSNQNPSSLIYNTSGIKTITLTVTANTSCTATATRTITIYPQPVANFSATAVCQSTATSFTDLSNTGTGTINAWAWDFTNDGITDNTNQNPTFVYPISGTYTTSLVVKTTNNCSNNFSLTIDVWGHSIPNFTPDNVCYGTATTFSNLTTTTNANVGTIASYNWNFADGSPSSITTNPIHTYTLGGNVDVAYSVTLTSTTSHNCVDQNVKAVHVYALPTASFTADSVCLGNPSHMVDASIGNSISAYIWDFLSDGSIDGINFPNPNYTFPTYGANAVTYTVLTNPIPGLTCGNVTNTIAVWVNPNPNLNFTLINKCINDQPLSFDASGSTIGVGTNTIYVWSYGDATIGNGITTTHSYANAGLYNVTLNVTSNKGCQTTIVEQAEVYQKPIMFIQNSNACDTKAMTFTAATQPASGNTIDWKWDFNNTISSIESNGETTSYIFPSPGSHTINLISETDKGCRDTLLKTIYVDYVPSPQFSVDQPKGCPLPHCVNFADNTPPITGPGLNMNWKWVFGDGTIARSSSSASQSHCYINTNSTQSALFDVRLVVTTDKGCTDSIEKTSFVTVYPKPIASYDASPDPGSVVTPLVYFNNHSHDYTRFFWHFGDGPFIDSIKAEPSHFYSDETANSYNTVLIVFNQYGCSDTAYVQVNIGPEFTFYIPNAFTPENDDDINELFTGKGIGIAEYEMWIYDRWGETIFYTDEITKGWDGKVQGKADLIKQDVYQWRVKLTDVLGKKHSYVGHVSVIK